MGKFLKKHDDKIISVLGATMAVSLLTFGISFMLTPDPMAQLIMGISAVSMLGTLALGALVVVANK